MDTAKLLIFSDTHISKFSGLFHKKAFLAGVMYLAAKLKKSPNSLLFHLGDITDSGTYEDFEYSVNMITKAFKQNGIPDVLERMHAIPGNHDLRNIGDQLWKEFYGSRHFFIHTQEFNTGCNLAILGIDSSEPDANTGRIGDRGIEEILKRFQPLSDDTVKILCTHHHLIPIPHTGRERSTILDAGDIIPVLWEAGVDIVITAHRHYPNIFRLSNGERRLLLINSGTFSSFKTRGKAGHTWVELDIARNKRVDVKFHGLNPYSIFQEPTVIRHPLEKGEIPTPVVTDQSESNMCCKIVHLSDTHYTEGREFRESVYEKGIEMIVNENPDFILHTGDVTDNSYPEEYDLAKKKLNEMRSILKCPLLLVPGPRDLQPYGKEMWISKIGSLDPVYLDDKFRIWGIDTGPDKNGLIGRNRLKLLEDDVKEYAKTKIFMIFMHGSLLPIPRAAYNRAVKDSGDAIHFLTLNKIPLVFSGLEHFATSLQISNTVFINAGTFSSRKIRSNRLNTYNSVSIFKNKTVKVEEVEIESGYRNLLGNYFIPIPLTSVKN